MLAARRRNMLFQQSRRQLSWTSCLATASENSSSATFFPIISSNSRWFGSKARSFRNLKVTEQLSISADADGARLWFIEVNYLDAPTETYAIPVKIASGEAAHSVSQNASHAIIAHFAGRMEPSCVDAIWDAAFRSQLFEAIVRRQDTRSCRQDNLSA